MAAVAALEGTTRQAGIGAVGAAAREAAAGPAAAVVSAAAVAALVAVAPRDGGDMVLTQDEARRIEAAVGAAETRTSSEIVVCIRRTSGEDRGVAALVGVVVLAAVAGLGATLHPEMNTYLLIA